MSAVVQSVTQAGITTGASLAVPAPASTAVGDLLLMTVFWRSTGAVIVPPSGWTSLRSDSGGGGIMARLGKVADSSDVSIAGTGSYTVTNTGTATVNALATIRRITGADTSNLAGTLITSAAGNTTTPTTTNFNSPATGAGASDLELVLRDVGVSWTGAGNANQSGAIWTDSALNTVKTNAWATSIAAGLFSTRETLSGSTSAPTRELTTQQPYNPATDTGTPKIPNTVTNRVITIKSAPTTVAPVNTVAPSITIPGANNPPRQGENLVGNIGTWTGTPAPTYAVEFQRDGVQIASTVVTGVTDPATTFTRTATANDVGHLITFHVSAANSAGTVTADSAGVTPVAQPALTGSDLPFLGSANGNLGGAVGAAIADNVFGNVFDNVVTTEVLGGPLTEYRVTYVQNLHPTATFTAIKAYISVNTPDAQTDAAIAYDASVGKNVLTAPLANEQTAPGGGVVFVRPTSKDDVTAISLPDLGPGDFVHLYWRRVVNTAASTYADDGATVELYGIAA